MPTNEERREIAAKLRETMLTEDAAIVEEREGLEPAIAARFVAIPNLIAALNFNKNIVSIRELTDRLANLIEPEPERTCSYVEHSDGVYHYYQCSECQCEMAGWDFEIYEPNYCMGCRAKITEVVKYDD